MSREPQSGQAPAPGSWLGSIALGVAVFAVYLSNGREVGSYDTEPTGALAVGLCRGEGVSLDWFLPYWGVRPGSPLPDYLTRSRGRVVSRYPIAPALLAAPAVAVQAAYLDAKQPGWDRQPATFFRSYRVLTKRAAALISALTAVVLHRVLLGLGFRRVAAASVLTAALGSGLWPVAGQALWQHGPAALALASMVWLLLPPEVSRLRLALAGTAAASLVAFRAIDVVFAAAVCGWVAWTHPRRLAWFLPGPVVGGAALAGFNLWFFGAVQGGLAGLEAMHPRIHALPAGPWSGDLAAGAAGTLFSPNRGLFVFSPWIALAVATLPVTARRIAAGSPIRWLLWALLPYGLLLSKYTVWWGGHCFGPRYWIDAVPLFAVALAYGLDWSYERRRPVVMAFVLASVASVGVQAVGAFCYPSSWNFLPANVDTHHDRLWNWRDTELSRCLTEGLKAPE